MTPKLFSELNLSPELLKAINQLGFEQASPIQAEAIPILLQGRDIVGQSQTGSGKTAAFAIPAIEKVDAHQRSVQVLILCPTRELAVQVSEDVHRLALFKRGIHALPIYGGQSYERQFHGLQQGAQIVIGTPGRVMDHMRRGTLRLDAVKLVVLDEADVMLDMGFREDIEFILQAVPAARQTVFFCATMPRPILELIQKYAREPQNVRIKQKTLTVPTVEQVYYEVMGRYKIELLTRLIDIHDLKLGIIFCNTKRMVDDLVDHLEAQGYSADRLHGDMTQNMRDRVMNKFRRSGLEFLVATDVAARGIDVDNVEVVFNYDLPYDVEDYVHRIGRTGRAGRSGVAISFVAGRELFRIYNIERYTNVKIRRAKAPTANEVEEARAGVFLDKLRATLQGGGFKRQDQLVERLLEEGFSSTDIASALIHQLQTGEAAPASRPTREAAPAHPDRASPRSLRPNRPAPRAPLPSDRSDSRRAENPAQARAATKPGSAPADLPPNPPAPGPLPAVPLALAAPAVSPEPLTVRESHRPSPLPVAPAPSAATTEVPAEAAHPAPAAAALPSAAPPLQPPPAIEPLSATVVRPISPRPEEGVEPQIPRQPTVATPPQVPPAASLAKPPKHVPTGTPSAASPAPRVPSAVPVTQGSRRAATDARIPRPAGAAPRPERFRPPGQIGKGPARSQARERSGPLSPPPDADAPGAPDRPAAKLPAEPATHRTPTEKHGEPVPPQPGPGLKPVRTEAGALTRLHMNLGEAMGIVPDDVVTVILGETGLPARVVGKVDIRERHLFVEVASEHANAIVSKLNRAQIKGRRAKVKVA